jgi:hypothetical protein
VPPPKKSLIFLWHFKAPEVPRPYGEGDLGGGAPKELAPLGGGRGKAPEVPRPYGEGDLGGGAPKELTSIS